MRAPRLSALLCALAFGCSVPLAAQLQRLSEVFRIAGPLRPIVGSARSVQGSPVAVAFPHGFAVASWKWTGQEDLREAVDGQLVDLSGMPGPGFAGEVLQSEADPNLEEPAVAATAPGNFVLVWVEWPWNIRFRRFAPGGVPLGSPWESYANSGDERVGSPAIAGNAAGSFVIGWEGDFLTVRTFAAAGTPVTPEIRVDPQGAGLHTLARVGIDAAGRFVVLWRQSGATAADPARLCAQAYGAKGGFLGSSFCLGDLAGATGGALALDPAGSYLAAWFAPAPAGKRAPLLVRRYRMDGTPLGGPVQVATTADPSQLTASADGRGNAALSWQEGDRMRVLLVGRDGAARGTAISIPGVAPHPDVDANGLALADSGRLLVTWRAGDLILGQLWQARF